MADELNLIGDVEGLGRIVYTEAAFDNEMRIFNKNKVQILSAEELAYAKMMQGKDSFISQNDFWIAEGDLYLPKEKKIALLKHSLVLKDPSKATDMHGAGMRYYISERDAYEALEKSEDALIFKYPGVIPCNRFGEFELPVFLFGKYAKDYGLFLKDTCTTMYLNFIPEHRITDFRGPWAGQLWLHHAGSDLAAGMNLNDVLLAVGKQSID